MDVGPHVAELAGSGQITTQIETEVLLKSEMLKSMLR